MNPSEIISAGDALGKLGVVGLMGVGLLASLAVNGFLARELIASFKERIKEGNENGRTAAQVAAALQTNADALRLQAMIKGAG